MTPNWSWRRWSPVAAFIVLFVGWYLANVAAYSSLLHSEGEAFAKVDAFTGRSTTFDIPSAWDWSLQTSLRAAALGIIGAALIAVLMRRASKLPWFVFAAALPIVVGRFDRSHEWWAAGPGIDHWTDGAGIGTRGLDLSHYGAGPAWTLAGGTALVVAAVLVPACLVRPAGEPAPRAHFLRALPYVALLTAAAGALTGALHIDSNGDGSSHEMLVATAAAALFAAVAAFVASEAGFWRVTAVTAAAAGLVMVSGLNPGAMSSTKWGAFAAAAGVALLGAVSARRPNLGLSPKNPQASHGADFSEAVG
jgi:hypothetical protein